MSKAAKLKAELKKEEEEQQRIEDELKTSMEVRKDQVSKWSLSMLKKIKVSGIAFESGTIFAKLLLRCEAIVKRLEWETEDEDGEGVSREHIFSLIAFQFTQRGFNKNINSLMIENGSEIVDIWGDLKSLIKPGTGGAKEKMKGDQITPKRVAAVACQMGVITKMREDETYDSTIMSDIEDDVVKTYFKADHMPCIGGEYIPDVSSEELHDMLVGYHLKDYRSAAPKTTFLKSLMRSAKRVAKVVYPVALVEYRTTVKAMLDAGLIKEGV